MTITHVLTAHARLTSLVVAAALVAACGGSSTAAPSAGASAAASAGASAAASAGASQAGASTEPASSPASGDAGAALSNLTSYKFKVGWTSTGVTGGTMAALGASVSIEGTAVLKPTKADDVTMNLGAMKLRVVEIGDQSWVDFGTGLVKSTDTSQSSMADSFAPDKLAASFLGSSMSGMKSVGDETKNGVAATHLQADATALGAASSSLAAAFGVDGNWTIDVWVAKDGGYLVSMVMAVTGTSSGADSSATPATFQMSIDITDVNNPANAIATPS